MKHTLIRFNLASLKQISVYYSLSMHEFRSAVEQGNGADKCQLASQAEAGHVPAA